MITENSFFNVLQTILSPFFNPQDFFSLGSLTIRAMLTISPYVNVSLVILIL